MAKLEDYTPYGLIKKGTDYGLSKLGAIYNNNRAKNSTQVGRSTSMNNFVTNAPVVPQNDFQLGQDYSLAGQDGQALGYTPLPTGDIPVINSSNNYAQAPIVNQGTSAMARQYNRGNGGLTPPPTMVSAIQPTGVINKPTDMAVQSAVVQDPMAVAKYNSEQSNLLADKNIAAQKDIAGMGQKSDMERYGSMASGVGSALGGVAGLYGAYMNAKYMKDQSNMQKNMIRGDEANKSAFAKAAGGTYIKSGV